MARPHHERLTGLDASFLLLESRDVYAHVASTLVFEGGPLRLADGGIDFEAIAKAHEALIERIPRYRQVLRFTPVTGQPVWVDDARFDLSYHLRHTSLPRPGSEAQLKRLSARVMQQHLDRERPLWETWIVEGLADGRFALIAKVHHCMVDGISGVDLLQILLSSRPDAELPRPEHVFQPRPEPAPWQLLRDDLARRAQLPVDAARGVGALVRGTGEARGEVEARARGLLKTLGMTLRGPSDTPLNQPIGPHRRFDWRVTELSEIRAIKRTLGGTVNDVVLAIVAGAFRRILRARGVELDGLDFRALAPVSVRREEERETLGNRVSGWILELPLAADDPAERLRAISDQTAELKASKHALGAELLTSVIDWAPSTLLALGARAAGRALPFNTIVTNVPGPQTPMYLLGAQLLEVYPHVPLVDRVDLGIALVSYAGRLHWGINADYDAVADLHAFAVALDESFQELRQAAARPAEAATASVAAAMPAPEHRPRESAARIRQRELTDEARERHDALTAAIDRLERALAAPAALRTKPWSERVAGELSGVRDAIRVHVEGVEERDGLFDEIQHHAPRLASRIPDLEAEHRELVALAGALASRIADPGPADFGGLRQQAATLLTRLRAHRAAEADIVYEAFWEDMGTGD